jgi:hypothetical protein
MIHCGGTVQNSIEGIDDGDSSSPEFCIFAFELLLDNSTPRFQRRDLGHSAGCGILRGIRGPQATVTG